MCNIYRENIFWRVKTYIEKLLYTLNLCVYLFGALRKVYLHFLALIKYFIFKNDNPILRVMLAQICALSITITRIIFRVCGFWITFASSQFYFRFTGSCLDMWCLRLYIWLHSDHTYTYTYITEKKSKFSFTSHTKRYIYQHRKKKNMHVLHSLDNGNIEKKTYQII